MTETGADTAIATLDGAPPDLGYQVRLDAFSGPLDLLLYLVRRAQVDIADIPIALLADQFIATVRASTDVDLDVAGDFVLMAATLLEIKSRSIAPPGAEGDGTEADEDGEGERLDPRADLIRQLLAYRSFKDAVGLLAELELERSQRLPRSLREAIPDDPDDLEGLSLDNADPYLLFSAWEAVAERLAGMGPRTVVYDDVPMEARMSSLATTMQAAGRARLGDLLAAVLHRVQRAGVLIAVLECTRQRLLEITQHEQYGDVHLRYRPPEEREAELAPPPEEPAEPRRRRRRAPLVTWHAPAAAPTTDEQDDQAAEEPEEVVESEETRFLREMNEACALDAVLARSVDLEAGFTAFLAARADASAPA
jgi:segregation and condensation protein A